MLIAIVLSILAVVILIALFIATWILTNVILKPKTWTTKDTYKDEVALGRLDEEFFQNVQKEEFIIKSRYGYDLSGMILSNEETNRPENHIRVAVLCHGYTRCKYGAVVYAQMLMEQGFTTVIYDHRNHGESAKEFTTMGYYEKFDLKTIIDYCYEKFGPDIRIVTHGESMGAATVLNHLAIDDRIACCIADCGYSDLKELQKFQLKTYYNLPSFPFISLANLVLKIRAGFWIKEVSPKDGAIHSKTPILFIHGEEDDFVPTVMSKKMYQAREGIKELYLCPGAKHAESCVVDPENYRKVITKFLDKYYV